MLCYVDDASIPGITRKRRGRYWMYFRADGSRVTDREEIDRLNAIGMPPAYERCWFCPQPNGHIQAVGFDAKGRKQYRYHPDFRAQQEALQNLVANLKAGDRIVTTSGIIATVTAVRERSLIVRSADKSMLEIARSAVAGMDAEDEKAVS